MFTYTSFRPRVNSAALALIAGLLITCTPVMAMPMFARKYDLPCARCHSMVPRLNPYGYAFFKAGFRLPGNNNNLSHKFQDVAAAIVDTSLQTASPAGDTGVGVDSSIKLASPVDPHVSAFMSDTFASVDEGAGTGFDELWMRYNSAPMGTFWTAAIGQLPVADGYNLAGDRNWMLTDAMIEGGNGPLAGSAAFPQGNFALSGLERGIQAGFNHRNLSARLSMLNGLTESGLGDVDATSSGSRFHDAAMQVEYLLPTPGVDISAVYYHGQTPVHDLVQAGNPVYNNEFYRAGLFGSYQRQLKAGARRGIPGLLLELNAGYLMGNDHPAIGAPGVFSDGGVAEADLYQNDRTAFGARYDWARVSETAGSPNTRAVTLCYAHQPIDNLKYTLEYRNQGSPAGHSVIAGLSFYY